MTSEPAKRTYAELLAEEARSWHDPSAGFNPSHPEIRKTWAGWSARFDDEGKKEGPGVSRGRVGRQGGT